MEEKELIKKIQSLKKIKPNENWVLFAKNQLFEATNNNSILAAKSYRERFLSLLKDFQTVIRQRKLAYSLAALSLLFVVVFGSGMWYNIPTTDEEPLVVVNGVNDFKADIKATVEDFTQKSQNLAQIINENPTDNNDEKKSLAVQEAIKEIKTAAKKLTDVVQNKPSLTKEVALELKNNKTLFALENSEIDLDLKETSDILYKTIDERMIKDLEKVTLTEDQEHALGEVKVLYEQGKYVQALEKILLIQ